MNILRNTCKILEAIPGRISLEFSGEIPESPREIIEKFMKDILGKNIL